MATPTTASAALPGLLRRAAAAVSSRCASQRQLLKASPCTVVMMRERIHGLQRPAQHARSAQLPLPFPAQRRLLHGSQERPSSSSSAASGRGLSPSRSSAGSGNKSSSSPLANLAGKLRVRYPHRQFRQHSGPFNENATNDSHTTSKGFAYFMLSSAASVFGIVVFGGLTRLTESGLSITQWKPVTGSLPPMSPQDWESEFALYKTSPEYAVLNPNMKLEEFKKIYFMEWFHRVWGRFIGVSYFAGLLYFGAVRGRNPSSRVLTRKMLLGSTAVLVGIGAQGAVGWWMVASGLTDDLLEPGAHPRVSHYRLATHLALAFGLYTSMYLMGSRVLRNRRLLSDPEAAMKLVRALQSPQLVTFRRLSTALTVLIFITALSGALVAGLDAGLIYNEFPMMGTGLAPPVEELFDKFYSRKEDGSDLWWRNLLENPSTVQLDHRILATTSFCAVLSLLAYSRTAKIAAVMPQNVKKGIIGVVHLTIFQVVLGISTLIYMVPIPLGALHQAGSLLVLTGALGLAHRLHVPKSLLPHIQKRLAALQKHTPRP